MTNETRINDNFRKLKYFLDNKIPVHFTEDDGTFYNGLLKDLVIEDKLVAIIDRKTGLNIVLAEAINTDSIDAVKEKE